MSIYPFLHFFAFLVYLYLIIVILIKDPKSWLNRSCAAFFACLALWSFAYIFIYNLNISKDTATLFGNISSIGWSSFASFFLWFCLLLTGQKKILKLKIFYLFIFILPLLFIYKQWTGFLIVDYSKVSYGWSMIMSESIWLYLYYIYYLSFTIGGLSLILNFKKKTKEPIKKRQAGIIFVTTLIPLILGTLTEVVLPELNIQTIPSLANVTTLIWAFGIAYAIAKYKFMVITSAVAAESIISTIADSLVLLDREGNIVSVNKATLDLSGYGKSELEGKSVEVLFREKDFKNTLLDKAIKKKAIRNYELNFKTKTGDNIPVVFSSSTMMDEAGGMAGIVCIIKGITERKKTEEALRKSQQEFISLFKSSPEALVYEDEKGTILNINPRFTELFGYTLEEVKGRNIDEGIIHPPEKTEEGKKLTKESFKGYINYETIRKKKDGTLFPVAISASPIIIDGQHKGLLAIYVDITERKRNELLQQVLYNISKAANSPISLDQLYKTIHQELSTIIDTTNFYIALLDQKKDILYFPYLVDEKDDNFPIEKFSTSNVLTAHVMKTGKPILNTSKEYEKMIASGELSPLGSTSPQSIWLGVPLKIEDHVIGAMAVQSYTDPSLYSKKDIKLLEFVSLQVAIAIQRKHTEERIKHLSFHDSLTDLYNRAYFEEELKRLNNPRYYPLSIISLDVNGLKVVNDTFGHDQGDKLLQHLAFLLTSISRKGDIIARVGGDEFAIIIPSTTSEQVRSFCERIRKVCLEDDIKPAYLRVNLALGHVTQEGEYKDINTLLKEADRNMYQDKLFSAKSREKHLLDSFGLVLAERDPHTEDHAQRLQELALALGKRIGLSEYQLNNLKLLALFHDIGKIGISDSILFKPHTLTPSEWKKMKEHPKIGYRMAKNISDFAPIAREILYHHEHWDGSGYPEGLKKKEIPILSRIIAIVDAYDVMQSRRPYKGKLSKDKALEEIKSCAGTQFDPQLVKIFLKIVKNKASRERKEPDKRKDIEDKGISKNFN